MLVVGEFRGMIDKLFHECFLVIWEAYVDGGSNHLNNLHLGHPALGQNVSNMFPVPAEIHLAIIGPHQKSEGWAVILICYCIFVTPIVPSKTNPKDPED